MSETIEEATERILRRAQDDFKCINLRLADDLRRSLRQDSHGLRGFERASGFVGVLVLLGALAYRGDWTSLLAASVMTLLVGLVARWEHRATVRTIRRIEARYAPAPSITVSDDPFRGRLEPGQH